MLYDKFVNYFFLSDRYGNYGVHPFEWSFNKIADMECQSKGYETMGIFQQPNRGANELGYGVNGWKGKFNLY
jgi:hypothetical protein